MIEFKPEDGNETRSAEIARELKKLDVEMASPNIKESGTPSLMLFTDS